MPRYFTDPNTGARYIDQGLGYMPLGVASFDMDTYAAKGAKGKGKKSGPISEPGGCRTNSDCGAGFICAGGTCVFGGAIAQSLASALSSGQTLENWYACFMRCKGSPDLNSCLSACRPKVADVQALTQSLAQAASSGQTLENWYACFMRCKGSTSLSACLTACRPQTQMQSGF